MASTYLTRTISDGSNTKSTFSAWVKRSGLGATASTQYLFHTSENANNNVKILFNSQDVLRVVGLVSSSTVMELTTNRKFRDTTAWYHIVVTIDTTESTAADRVKMYINGVQETSFSTATYPAEDYSSLRLNNNGDRRTIGTIYDGGGSAGSGYFDGSMSHVHWVDGTAYQASTFGSTDATTGEWKINTSPTLTMGTNGFTILKDGNTITDQSANSNNFTLGAGTLSKTEDCPSNIFATLNVNANKNANQAFTNGNNTHTSSTSWLGAVSSLGAYAGKYYAEFKIVDRMNYSFGVCQSNGDTFENLSTANNNLIGKYADAWGFAGNDGTTNNKRTNNTNTSYGEVFSDGDIAMIAMDVTGGKIYFGRNGTWFDSSNPATGASPAFTGLTFTESMHFASGLENANGQWNFGNGYFGTTAVSSAGSNASSIGIFEYDVPSGYTALSTKGLNE